MKEIILALLAWVLCVEPIQVLAARIPAQVQTDITKTLDQASRELARTKRYLSYYDQVQRMEVVQGRLSPGDAEARLKGKGRQLYANSFSDEELRLLIEQHRQACRAYIARIEQEIKGTTRWPQERPAESYRKLSQTRLAAVREELERYLARELDPKGLLEEATEILAWTSGEKKLLPAANPFAGQNERVAAAIPDATFQRILGRVDQSIAANEKPSPTVQPAKQATARAPAPGVPGPGPSERPAPAPAPYPRVPSQASRAELFQRAVERLWKNDLRGALDDLTVLSASDPNDIEARRIRILAELAAGSPVTARREADALLSMWPNDPQILLVHGQAALWNNNQESARRDFERVMNLKPGMAAEIYQQANQMLDAGVLKIAHIQYVTVLWLDPNSYGAHYGLGLAASRLGYRDQAIQAFENYLRSDSTSAFANNARQQLQQLRSRR